MLLVTGSSIFASWSSVWPSDNNVEALCNWYDNCNVQSVEFTGRFMNVVFNLVPDANLLGIVLNIYMNRVFYQLHCPKTVLLLL